jgi:hypothetical protein
MRVERESARTIANGKNRRLVTSTVCVLAGLLASFRQPTPAKAEHSLPPVIRLDIDNNDNAVVPACRTITGYLNNAANPNARTSWQIWASGNECEALNDRVAQKGELELYHIYITCSNARMVSSAFVS